MTTKLQFLGLTLLLASVTTSVISALPPRSGNGSVCSTPSSNQEGDHSAAVSGGNLDSAVASDEKVSSGSNLTLSAQESSLSFLCNDNVDSVGDDDPLPLSTFFPDYPGVAGEVHKLTADEIREILRPEDYGGYALALAFVGLIVISGLHIPSMFLHIWVLLVSLYIVRKYSGI